MQRYFGNDKTKKNDTQNRFQKDHVKHQKPKFEKVYKPDKSDDAVHGDAPVPNEGGERLKSEYQQGKKTDLMQPKFEKVYKPAFDAFHGVAKVPIDVLKKYQRGKKIDFRGIKSKSKRRELINVDKKFRESVRQAARNEILLTEEAGYIEPDKNEDTYRIQQEDIAAAVDIASAAKLFSLSLTEFGPYKIDYSRDGRHLLLGGYLGHVAAMDWVSKKLACEMNVMESVHAISWLHLPTMFAVAQKQWVYVYDNNGVELHCVKLLNRILQMEFLPYHFLLVASSEKGFLSWLDVCVGKLVKHTYTPFGRLNIMCQNPYNAVVATGHPNGTVTMWSPNVEEPLVKILCQRNPLRSIAIDSRGLYLATSSTDNTLNIYDVRTYKCLKSYKLRSAAGYLDFSQTGLLSVGLGKVVEVYKDCCTQAVEAPYLRHRLTSTVTDVQFCPYEDVLGIGSSYGFNSILIPGAGEPNFDAYESNPYMTKSQRREMEVKSLLEKIQPELITLNPGQLGTVNVESMKEKMEKLKSQHHIKPRTIEFEPRPKMKSRSKSAHVFKRKKIVKETVKRNFIKAAVQEKSKVQEKSNVQEESNVKKKISKHQNVLDRFQRK